MKINTSGFRPSQSAAISEDPPRQDPPCGGARLTGAPAPATVPTPQRMPDRARRNAHATKLHQLPSDLVLQIADQFDYGSPHVSRLASTNRALHTVLADRALADRLIAQAQLPIEGQDIAAHFCRLIENAARLPSNLRIEVLCRIPSKLTSCLSEPVPDFDRVFNALAVAHGQIIGASLCYRGIHALGAEFTATDLRNRCLRQQAQRGSAMEIFYVKFFKACEMLLISQGAAVGASSSTSAGLSARHRENILYADTLSMLARGLYMLADPRDRKTLWHKLQQNRRCGAGLERVVLLEGLTDALPDLLGATNRFEAFSLVLAEVEQLSAEHRPAMLSRLAQQLQHIATEAESNPAFTELLAAAARLPPANMAQALAEYARCVSRVVPAQATFVFNAILGQMVMLEPAGHARVLAELSAEIVHLPNEEDRGEAFDAVWHAFRGSDPRAATAPMVVAHLIAALAMLPGDDQQQIQFSRLTDYLMWQQVGDPDGLIGRMAGAVSALGAPGWQMAAFYDVLTLITKRPPDAQGQNLLVLIDQIGDLPFDDTRFAMLAAFERAVRGLPAPLQVELLNEAAASAIWLVAPFMQERFAALVAAAQNLPTPNAEQVLAGIERALLNAVDELSDPKDASLPAYFDAIVKTSRVVPQALQIHTLEALIDAAKAYPPAVAQSARELILPCLQDLPDDLSQPLYHRLGH